ncbi:SRPBCC domain-containing protein [Qipengyuania sp. JC766]|uniref:SRPBCC domain-containing protein n=1 Tax=Qipengyuania sp. JC766 TaxID=3232139 RepID=UPI003458B176
MSEHNELTVTTYIDAPTEKVWKVMAYRQTEWFCPAPWKAEVVEQDRRPGGRDAMMFHGPDGEEMPQEGIFLAWDEGRRFASTDAIVGDLEPAGPFMIGIWQVEPEGDGTRYTGIARHWSDEERKKHEAMGFLQGWQAAAAQLKAICENDS